MNEAVAKIKIYGTTSCADCRRAKQFLRDQEVPYDLIDLDEHPEMRSIVEQRNGGAMVIPTIVLPDGSHLAEPTNEELAAKVGLRPGFT